LNNVNVEKDLRHKSVLPSQPVLQQIPQVFTKQYFNYEPRFGDFELDNNREMCQIKPKEEQRDHCCKMANSRIEW
jgi:hypothetical protein